MTTIVKTFFIEKDIIHPKKIHKRLREISISERSIKGLNGVVYSIKEGKIRYYFNSIEILTYNKKNNYQIRSKLEEILNLKLLEPN